MSSWRKLPVKIKGWGHRFDQFPDLGEGKVYRQKKIWNETATDWRKSLKARPHVAMLFDHDTSKIIGTWDKIAVKKEGIWVEGSVYDETAAAQVLSGSLFALSRGVSWDNNDTISINRHDQLTELIHENLDVVEISLCFQGFNPESLILEKSAASESKEKSTKESIDELLKASKENADMLRKKIEAMEKSLPKQRKSS